MVYDLSYPDEKKILVYFEPKGGPLPKKNENFFLRTQFFHFKMADSFPKYLTSFQELLNQMTDHSGDDTDILYKFTDGLTKEYALAVRRDKCETLNEAIKCVKI